MLRGGRVRAVLGGVSQVNAALSAMGRYRGLAAILSQIAVEWVTKAMGL